MNHRQWKKRFKKIHGRNPSIMEDKKKAAKCIKSFMPELAEAAKHLSEALPRVAEQMAKALIAFTDRMEGACARIGEMMERIRAYDTNDNR